MITPMFQKGQPKRGGRVKGTPNKVHGEIEEKLKKLGCDPIAGLAAIAMDQSVDVKTRAHCYSELAQYIAPKRKALEHSGEISNGGGGVLVVPAEMSMEQWLAKRSTPSQS
jgi:hypothetical protein